MKNEGGGGDCVETSVTFRHASNNSLKEHSLMRFKCMELITGKLILGEGEEGILTYHHVGLSRLFRV